MKCLIAVLKLNSFPLKNVIVSPHIITGLKQLAPLIMGCNVICFIGHTFVFKIIVFIDVAICGIVHVMETIHDLY